MSTLPVEWQPYRKPGLRLKVSVPKENSCLSNGVGRNPEVNFHGQKRKNDTHASTTDPDARLYRKGKGKEAKLYINARAYSDGEQIRFGYRRPRYPGHGKL